MKRAEPMTESLREGSTINQQKEDAQATGVGEFRLEPKNSEPNHTSSPTVRTNNEDWLEPNILDIFDEE